jgi:hypothetical protein
MLHPHDLHFLIQILLILNSKTSFFAFFALFCISHFSKKENLTTLRDWYQIARLLAKFSTLGHALADPIRQL